jgi:hypothetical protein
MAAQRCARTLSAILSGVNGMRVSKYFRLGRNQATLDFVDVDVEGDARLFVDPRALRLLDSDWGHLCVSLIQDFFKTVLDSIHRGNHERARLLLSTLREPNETHLGLSKGKARGRALGTESAAEVWEALSKSDAVATGLLEDLEDTILLVPGISSDIVSDMATNIMRGPLIAYTQDVCSYYEIPVTEGIDSGPVWDPEEKDWHSNFTPLPITRSGKLLLVPKAIVRKRMDYNEDEYFNYYILAYLREKELSANTELVQLLKNGKMRVTKKDLVAKYGSGKEVALRYTIENPRLLQNYRRLKLNEYQTPLDHGDLVDYAGDASPDWDMLFNAVSAIPSGREDASRYEKAIESLLTALFYPNLTNPRLQHEIHSGRKRIDITYTNTASSEFFKWLATHYNAPYVFIECKNYASDPANPELDQLSGRFSVDRGRFGILVCRSLDDRHLIDQRCKDTANDGRGFIIAFDDSDLRVMCAERKANALAEEYLSIKAKYEALIM